MKTIVRTVSVFVALAFWGMPSQSVAQVLDIPSSADAGRIHNDLEVEEPKQVIEQPAKEKAYEGSIPEGAEDVILLLRSVAVEGSSIYTQEELSVFYEGLTGKEATLARVYQIAHEITQKYREDGYVLSQAMLPPQDVTDGHVMIKIVEGYVGRIEKSGEYERSEMVDDILFSLIEDSKPFNIQRMESALLRLNDLPGVEATAVLKPISKTAGSKGAVDLEVVFRKGESRGSVSLNNSGSKYLGPWQAGVTATVPHNIIIPHQETTIGGLSSSEREELKHIFFKNTFFLNAHGTKFDIYANYTKTQPGFDLRPLDVKGSSYGIGFSLTHPLIRSRQENMNVYGVFDYNHSETSIASVDIFDDNTRTLRLGVNYDAVDGWNGSNFIDLQISKGVDVLGSSGKGDDNLSRAEGNPEFVKFTLEAERLQRVTEDFNLYFGTEFQISDSPLLSFEEFGYGGRRIGRAYDSSEITGDNGASALMELQYNGLPSYRDIVFQPYAFYDIGKVWNQDEGSENLSGSSAGGGLRLTYKGINADFTIALPLTKAVDAHNSSNDKNPRFFFSLSYNF